jgi:mannose-1-phosphate guanylyltransferase
LELLGADDFLIVNGDTLTDVRLDLLAEAHHSSGALVTLALAPNRASNRYRSVRVTREGVVSQFRCQASDDSYHFIGVQIVNADVFRHLPIDAPTDSIGGIYDALMAARPGAIRGFVSDAAFWDIGTAYDYWTTSRTIGRAENRSDVIVGRRVSVHPTARVAQSILWDDVEVGSECDVQECVIADGVRVPAGARFRRVVLTRSSPVGLRVAPLPLDAPPE